MKTKQFVIVLLTVGFVLLFVVGCSSAAEPAPAPATTIEGVVWQWLSAANRSTSETTTVPNPENYTIIFNEDGRFAQSWKPCICPAASPRGIS